MSLQEGPPVAAEDLRPNCSVRAATGGWLEVQCSDVLAISCDMAMLQYGKPKLAVLCSHDGQNWSNLRQVEAVTFKHVQQCDVIQLTLEGDAPNLCITARQRVARASREKEVGTVGNSMIANGPFASVLL
jgi:hypothetical protein